MLFASTCLPNASIQYLYDSYWYVPDRYKAPGYKAPSNLINYIYYAYLSIIYECLSDVSNFLLHRRISNYNLQCLIKDGMCCTFIRVYIIINYKGDVFVKRPILIRVKLKVFCVWDAVTCVFRSSNVNGISGGNRHGVRV